MCHTFTSTVLTQDRLSKQQEYIRSMQDWYAFKGETKEYYGIDMGVLEVRCGRVLKTKFVAPCASGRCRTFNVESEGAMWNAPCVCSFVYAL